MGKTNLTIYMLHFTAPFYGGKIFILALATLIFFHPTTPSRDRNKKPYRLVCYWGAWSTYRPEHGKFTTGDIDPFLCTHLIYAFAVLENNTIVSHDVYLDLEENYGLGSFRKFNNLRKQNPELTCLIGIGGWNDGDPKEMFKYSKMANDTENRKMFVESVVEFLKKYDFDGLDFDWEYPGLRDGILIPEDRESYIRLLEELRAAFEPDGFLLTAAVAAGKATIDAGYNVKEVTKNLDFINVMTYDFHGKWENFTGHNAPLFYRPDESVYQRIYNVNFSVRYWLSKGAQKEKLVIGIPLYGKCYYLKDPSSPGYGVPVEDYFPRGPITNQTGVKAYYEICDTQKNEEGWKIRWNEHHRAPSTYRGEEWCSYDDRRSVREKIDYLRRMGISSAMIWSLDMDDFRGFCFRKKFPLISSIRDRLSGHHLKKLTLATTKTPMTTSGSYNTELVTPLPAEQDGENMQNV